MASSGVEIASTPFDSVLRDHNQRGRCRDGRKLKRSERERMENYNSSCDENFHHQSSEIDKRAGKKQGSNRKYLRCNRINNAHNKVSDDSFSRSSRKSQTPNIAASSLVQVWESRIHPSSYVSIEEPSRSPDRGELVEEKCGEQVANVDSSSGYGSERTIQSDRPSSSHSRISDFSENERVRVVDIVKKLISPGHDNDDSGGAELPRRKRSSSWDQVELKVLIPQIISAPRIRGRQAFNDLLLKMGHDRKRELDALLERHAVSQFSQRGRIQSMLRLKILQRDLAAKERRQPKSPTLDKRASQGFHIMQLREKLNMAIEHCIIVPRDDLNPRSPHEESENRTQNENEVSIYYQQSEDSRNQQDYSFKQHNTSIEQQSLSHIREDIHEANSSSEANIGGELHLHTTEDEQKEANPSSEMTWQRTSSDDNTRGEVYLLSHTREDDKKEAYPTSEIVWQVKSPEVNTRGELHLLSRTTEDDQKEANASLAMTWQGTRSDDNIREVHVPSHSREDDSKEANPNSDTTLEATTLEASNFNSQNFRESSDFPWQGKNWDSGNFYSEETMFLDNWDEDELAEEEAYEQFMETGCDWISDVARPISYWEDCRKARYQELLDRDSNNEIRQLLERGTVSNFLSSNLRDRIDRLMESRLQVTCATGIQDEENSQEALEQLLSSQRDTDSEGNNEEEREGEEWDIRGVEVKGEGVSPINPQHHETNERELKNRVDQHYKEASELEAITGDEKDDENGAEENEGETGTAYFDQCNEITYFFDHSPLLSRSSSTWSCQDHEISNNSDQAPSATSNSPLQSKFLYQRTQHNASSMICAATDMEIVNDLRGQMEQLQNEMSELRKSMKLCIDMQIEMKQMIEQKVLSAPRNEKKALNKRSRKGRCCVCCETQIDSLLYRCGHMCTCLKCARELQRSSGECPACCAPIDDVVRVHRQS